MASPLKCYGLAVSALTLWLAALSPMPQKVKGGFYFLALAAGVQLIQESKNLILIQSRDLALKLVNQELEKVELTLHSIREEDNLKAKYAAAQTYAPEVREEINESLEHLYTQEEADHPVETSAYTSDKKALYLSIKSLLEVKSKTYVIEEVLNMGGRNWKEGEQLIEQILAEGESQGW